MGIDANCVRPLLGVSISAPNPTDRAGEIYVRMKGPAGSQECQVRVASREVKNTPTKPGDTDTGGTGKKLGFRRNTGTVKPKKPQ